MSQDGEEPSYPETTTVLPLPSLSAAFSLTGETPQKMILTPQGFIPTTPAAAAALVSTGPTSGNDPYRTPCKQMAVIHERYQLPLPSQPQNIPPIASIHSTYIHQSQKDEASATSGSDLQPIASHPDLAAVNLTNVLEGVMDSRPSLDKTPSPSQPKPLSERVPSTEAVLKVVRSEYLVKRMIGASIYFGTDVEIDRLFKPSLWVKVSDGIYKAITDCAASSKKEIGAMADEFEAELQKLIDTTIPNIFKNVDGDLFDKEVEASIILQYLGIIFVREYQMMIEYSGVGGKPLSITGQVDFNIDMLLQSPLSRFFQDDTKAEHCYYIVGFLGNQLIGELGRRKEGSDVRQCMEALVAHFVVPSNDAASSVLDEICNTLPTSLVDSRLAFGGLKYPDLMVFSVFAVVEVAFAEVATPENVITQGGRLPVEICDAISDNAKLFDAFSSIFGEEPDVSKEAMVITFRFMMKVFAHVHVKDLVRRYNGVVFGGSTMALRPTLAALSQKGKTKKKKGKTNKEVKTATAEDKKDHQKFLDLLSNFNSLSLEDHRKNKKNPTP